MHFGENSQSPCDFAVGFRHAAEVSSKTILVQLFVRTKIPQTHRVRRNFISENDTHHLAFPEPSEFYFEIHKSDADSEEQPRQEVVDSNRQCSRIVKFLRGRPTECRDVLLSNHRVMQLVVFEEE